jgi:regulation of enolase protein 1 (concanavalin A-like superfamily)
MEIPTIRSRSASRLLLVVVICMLVGARAFADTVTVTSGYLDLRPTLGPLLLGGDRGFTFQSQLSSSNSIIFALNCNNDPLHCLPGTTLNLGIHATGGDVSGIATLQGVTYGKFGGIDSVNNMALDFAGSLVLPSLAPTAVLTAPFTLTGTFTHTVDSGSTTTTESLTGSGTATVSLVADTNFPGSWRVGRILYSLNQSLPTGWVSADIGVVGQPGSASFANDAFSLTGSGADIWGTTDGFRFTFQPLMSDGEIVARVDTLSNTNPFAKAGLMMRQSADASAAHVLIDVKPDGGIELLTRSAGGGSTTFVAGETHTFPVWLKLSRMATTITGSISSDGVSWTPIGTADLPTTPLLAGMVVTSHDNSVTAEAQFSQVSIGASTLPSPWSAADIGAVGAAGNATFAGGNFTVQGSGADIWGTADAFTFVFRSANDNAQITTQVKSLENTDTFAKAGIMMRASTDPSSAHVILDVRPNGFVELMTRATPGGETIFIAGTQASFPVSLRLARTGSVITGYVLNGTEWTPVGSTSTSLPATMLVGLAVTSHQAGTLTTAVFGPTAVAVGSGAFQSQDIGDVGIAGGVVFDNGIYTVAGAGADIWGTSDSFQYAYMPFFSDFFVARVVSVENTNPFAKAGIMIRESLAPDSAHVILDVRPTGDIEFMMRPSTGAETQFITGTTATTPVWLKLTRDNATTVTAWVGQEVNVWVAIGSATLPVGSWASPLVGLAVTSHDTSRLNTSVFDRTP